MIAIVDGGATKCDWLILDNSGKEIIRTQTIGFNPNVVDAHLIPQEIEKNEMLRSIKKQMEKNMSQQTKNQKKTTIRIFNRNKKRQSLIKIKI